MWQVSMLFQELLPSAQQLHLRLNKKWVPPSSTTPLALKDLLPPLEWKATQPVSVGEARVLLYVAEHDPE